MAAKSQQKKTGAQLRSEREKRITDAIRLKIPDRVPIICGMGYFPAKYAGIPSSAAYYDFDAWLAAYKKTLPDFPADMIYPQVFTPGDALEILNPKQLRWPGHGVNPNHGHQSIEIDNMRGDEYDAYISDPSDYMFRIHMSRVSEDLAGLATLPKLSGLQGMFGAQALAVAVTSPEAVHAIQTLQGTGRAIRRYSARMKKFDQMILDLGFPRYFQGAAMPPYDVISHSMRGMTGTMTDMYRRPDKVLAACEKILELTLARPLPKPSEQGNIRMFMTNTRGSDDFLSPKHFDTFYWPTFKRLVQGLIDRGATPCIFF
ncbi:MAG TPA: uroporphyrinogen decarboxylase family protein, partial [Dehalococcoidales bacterium]